MAHGLKDGIIFTIDNDDKKMLCVLPNVYVMGGEIKDHINELNNVDMVFFDSDHQIHSIVRDIELLIPKLSTDAFLIIHDTVYCPEMGNALRDYFCNRESEILKTIPLKPSQEKWIYEEKKTKYGLGVAKRGEKI